jgi:importin-5
MRSFSLVLLRRLLFRASPAPTSKSPRLTLYDRLSAQTLTAIERILLHSLLHEQIDSVRRKAVDTICDLANNSMERGRPWHALQAQSFAMCKSADSSARESAFRIFAGCPNLVMDLQTDAVLRVLQEGLQDRQSIEVCLLPHLLSPADLLNFCFRSGTPLFALPYPTSPPATNTKSRSPCPSCTPCWTPFPLSPTPTCPDS